MDLSEQVIAELLGELFGLELDDAERPKLNHKSTFTRALDLYKEIKENFKGICEFPENYLPSRNIIY